MNFIVRFSLFFSIVLTYILCLSPVFAAPSTKTDFQVIASRHKFEPRKQSVAVSVAPERLVIIADPKELVKRRPPNYGLKRLSGKTLRRAISAKSAIVMDAVNGDTLYAHLPDRSGQPASTIKVLTGLISMDSLPENEMVKVSRRAARMPRSKIYLRRGKNYPANDLINAVLLASANDASVALAEKIAGSEKVFAKLMTAKAESFGATNTVCKTASGLTARGQKSTVRDLAKIFNKAMRNPQFAGTMARTKIRTREGRVLRSHNKALWQVDGAEGGKTGYTNLARQTYVGKFKRDSDELVVAIMGSETMWDDVKRLVEYGFAKKKFVRQDLAAARQERGSSIKLVQIDLKQQKDNPLIISNLKMSSDF